MQASADVEVRGFGLGDHHALGQQISNAGMQFAAALLGAERGPGKDAGTKIDCGRINNLDFMAFFLAPAEFRRNFGEKMVLELVKNNGRPMFISCGQSRPLNDTQAQAVYDLSKRGRVYYSLPLLSGRRYLKNSHNI